MDASAFVSKEQWDEILARNGCDEVMVFQVLPFVLNCFLSPFSFEGEKKEKGVKG
jgi:hypothetical protein